MKPRSNLNDRFMNMKYLVGLLALVWAMGAAAVDLETAQPVTLTWDYTNQPPDISFRVYVSRGDTNSWVGLLNTTNLSVTLILQPDVYYFRVTALTFWAESDPSNTAVTPKPDASAIPTHVRVKPGAVNKPDTTITK